MRERPISDYWRGFEDGIRRFAWWKDGTEYVGTCGKTLKQAIHEAKQDCQHEFPAADLVPYCVRCGIMKPTESEKRGD